MKARVERTDDSQSDRLCCFLSFCLSVHLLSFNFWHYLLLLCLYRRRKNLECVHHRHLDRRRRHSRAHLILVDRPQVGSTRCRTPSHARHCTGDSTSELDPGEYPTNDLSERSLGDSLDDSCLAHQEDVVDRSHGL